MSCHPAAPFLFSTAKIAFFPPGVVEYQMGGRGLMKKNNWLLFALLLIMAIAWGVYYWLFIIPGK
jgi:hypothetical protein